MLLNEISELVKKLTLPIRYEHWLPVSEDDPSVRLHIAYAPALLDQLLDLGGGSGGYGRGGSEKRTRAVVDFQAMAEYHNIRVEIHELLLDLKGEDYHGMPIGEAKSELRQWYQLYMRYATNPGLPIADERRVKRVRNTLRGWASGIEDKFDPPKQKELLIECPNSWLVGDEEQECGARYYFDAMGDRASAVVAFVRPGDVWAKCRVCGGTWSGEHELMMLGISTELRAG